MLDITYNSVNEGIEKLRTYVKFRNTLKGKPFWSLFHDSCNKLSFSLIKDGVDRKDIIILLNG